MNHDDVYYALQDKLHDKEARIRELEGALRNIQSVCMDEVMHHYEKVKQIDSMCDNALAPPASEPEDANEAAFSDLIASGGLAETMETRELTGTQDHLPSDEDVEKYIRTLNWRRWTTNHEKSLVAGNIRTFAKWVRKWYEDSISTPPCSMCGGFGRHYWHGEPVEACKRCNGTGKGIDPAPPDSEPAEGEDDRTPNERALEEADDSANYAYPDDTAERQDVMLERREAVDEMLDELKQFADVGSERTADPVSARSRIGELARTLRKALSRTSDEGTGCVVPEAIKRLPYELRREAENRCGCCDPDATMPGCDCMNLDDARGEGRDQEKLDIASRLDRAIAQQGK